MKKWIVTLMVFLLICGSLNAEINSMRYKITESEKEFDVIYYVTEDMKIIDSKNNDDIHITQAFEINKDNLHGEVRYSLFTDLGGTPETLKINFMALLYICINNIAGYDIASEPVLAKFNDADVKKEFNGDFGYNAVISKPKSEYGKGYNFIMLEFFCKEGQGLVVRAFLFNDIAFIGLNKDGTMLKTSPFLSNYYTFKFMNKDAAGNFVTN